MTAKEKKIEDLRKELQKKGQMGMILRTTEEAALDFFNRSGPELVIFVFKAWNEFETHADTMKQSLDDLKTEADRIRPTLAQAEDGENSKKLLDLLVKDGLFSEHEIGIGRKELREIYAPQLPESIVEKAEQHIDLFERLHPITIALRRKYEKDEEQAAQTKAGGHLLGMFISDSDPDDKAEDHEDGLTYTDYIKAITKEDLEQCADNCNKANRKSWGEQFEALAEAWDDYDTDARKKALKDELTIEKRLTFEASVYLYRCIVAKLEHQPPAAVPEDLDELPLTANYPDETFFLPIDYISRGLFTKDLNGQMQFLPEIGRGNEANEMITCDFSRLPETVRKRLTPFDKRVACAYYSLARIQKDGAPSDPYKAITKGDICRRMKIDPDKTGNKKKVLESMRKMKGLSVRIDTRNDFTGAFETVYDDYFIPCAIIPGKNHITGEVVPECFLPRVNESNALTNSPVPYIAFADGQGQITAFDSKYLDTKWQTTDDHIAIEDYILRRVQTYKNHEKKGEAWENSRTIVIDEIFKECNITDRRRKEGLRDAIDKKLLPDFVKMGLFSISNREYKTTKDKNGNPLNREDFKGLLKFTFRVTEDPRLIMTAEK